MGAEAAKEYEIHDAERLGRIRAQELKTGVRSAEIAEEDLDAADYFAQFLDNLSYLLSISSDPTFIGSSEASSSTVAFTDGVSVHFLGWTMSHLNKKQILHANAHEKEHIHCTCSRCELFKELSPDHRSALYGVLGFVADLDGVEADEGSVEAKIQKKMGNNLGAYPALVKIMLRLEEVVQKEFGISLFQLHSAAKKGEMARAVKLMANRALLNEVLAEEQNCTAEEKEYCLTQMGAGGIQIIFQDKQDARNAVSRKLNDFRTMDTIRAELLM